MATYILIAGVEASYHNVPTYVILMTQIPIFINCYLASLSRGCAGNKFDIFIYGRYYIHKFTMSILKMRLNVMKRILITLIIGCICLILCVEYVEAATREYWIAAEKVVWDYAQVVKI